MTRTSHPAAANHRALLEDEHLRASKSRIFGQRLMNNTGWTLLGSAAPMLVGLITIPPLMRGLGGDRFALLTLSWAAVGYFGLFDLGIGRGLTKVTSEALASNNVNTLPSLFWGALALMLAASSAGSLLLTLLAGPLVTSILNVPKAIQGETRTSVYIIALTIPLVTTSAGFRGYLEAHHRFAAIASVRVVLGIAGFVLPLIAMTATHRLPLVMWSLALSRVAAWLVFLALCLRCTPALKRVRMTSWSHLRPILRFGGWITLTNLLSPLMTTLDRFIIGAVMPLSTVNYYAIPSEIIAKINIVPNAITIAVFPSFSYSIPNDPKRSTLLYNNSLNLVLLGTLPALMSVTLFARELLTLWLGASFAAHSYILVQIVATTYLVNTLAFIPAAFLQAAGRPDLNAKLHACELPAYFAMLYFLARAYGVYGIAFASLFRTVVDAIGLFWLAARWKVTISHKRYAIVAAVAWVAALLSCALGVSLLNRGALVLLAISSMFPLLHLFRRREFMLRQCRQ